jgi:aryl-phospho-beta-D-glucosidase BglC (GH1 family)
MTRKLYNKLLAGLVIAGSLFSAYSQTPVQKHGKLSTSGPYLLNQHGQIVQLRGMSFFWSRSDWGGTKFYTRDWVQFLKNDWKCTVLRAAYDRNEGNNNGWNEVKTVIDACIDEGIYVIIDWHSHTAHNQQSAAVDFFSKQAKRV